MDREHAEPLASPLREFFPLAGVPIRGTTAYRRYARGAQKCYKPTSTRWPFLICILLLTFGLIAVVEIACHTYPVENYYQNTLFGLNFTRRDLIRRSEDDISRYGLQREGDDPPRHLWLRDGTSLASSRPTDGISTATPSSGSYISTTSQPAAGSAGFDGIISKSPIFSTAYVGPSSYITPGATDGGAYLPTITYTEMTGGTGAYIPTDPTVSPSASEGAYIPTSSPAVVTTVTLPDGDAAGGETGTTILGAYVPTSSPGVVTTVTLPGGDAAGGETGTTSISGSGDQPFYTQKSGYIDPTVTSSGSGGVSTTITLPDDDPTGTTIPGAYITTSSIPVSGTREGAYIPTSGTQSVVTTFTLPPGGSTQPIPVSTDVAATDQGAYITVTSSLVPVSTLVSGGTAIIMIGTPTKTALVPVSTIQSSGIEVVVMGTPSASSLVPISTVTSSGITRVVYGLPPETGTVTQPTNSRFSGTGSYSVITTLVTSTSGSVAYVYETTMTLSPTTSKASPSQSYSVITTLMTSTSGSVAYVYKTTMTLSPTTSIVAATQAAATSGPDNGSSTLPFTPVSYFAAWYLPTIVAVVLRTIWTVVYNNARMMEPFYRLALPNGVSGRNALDSLYLSMGTIVPEPILALFSGHPYMVIVSSITYIIELVAPLSSEFLEVDVQHGCTPAPGANPNHPCSPRLIVRMLPARILQGVLGLIGLLIITAVFLSYHRQPGIYSDPSCIATMASLLHHPDVVDDFMDLADADDAEVARLLDEQTYRLAHYQAGAEGMKYGIVPVTRTFKSEVRTKGAYSAVSNPENVTLVRRHRRTFFQRHLWRTLGDIMLGGLLLGLLGVVVAFYLDGKPDGFNLFFLSQSFGPKFVLVFAAGLIVTQWKRIEREVRTYQPYRHLSSKTTSSPTHTILSTTTSTPWTTLPTALYHGHFFTALVAFCYIISEILVIVVATIPFSNNQYYLAFISGTYITFGIVGLQIIVFALTVTWWRWKGPRLERDPDTLLGVWILLAHSEIRGDFEDLGTAGRMDLVETVKACGRRYWLGEMVGKDGVARMGIHGDEALAEARFEGLRVVHPDGVVSHIPYRTLD